MPGSLWFHLVPKGGFEPPRGCPHQTLNLERLPVPPLRHVLRGRRRLSQNRPSRQSPKNYPPAVGGMGDDFHMEGNARMRDQEYWERWLRQRPEALRERRGSVKDWYREAGVEKGERRAFKAALKALNPDGVKGKRERKPPRRGKGRFAAQETPYGAPASARGGGGRIVEGRLRFTREGRPLVIPENPEEPAERRRTAGSSGSSSAGSAPLSAGTLRWVPVPSSVSATGSPTCCSRRSCRTGSSRNRETLFSPKSRNIPPEARKAGRASCGASGNRTRWKPSSW